MYSSPYSILWVVRRVQFPGWLLLPSSLPFGGCLVLTSSSSTSKCFLSRKATYKCFSKSNEETQMHRHTHTSYSHIILTHHTRTSITPDSAEDNIIHNPQGHEPYATANKNFTPTHSKPRRRPQEHPGTHLNAPLPRKRRKRWFRNTTIHCCREAMARSSLGRRVLLSSSLPTQ